MSNKDVIRYTRIGLTAAAIVFSLISLIDRRDEKKKNGSLIFALLCVSVSNLLSDIDCVECEFDDECDCGCCDCDEE